MSNIIDFFNEHGGVIKRDGSSVNYDPDRINSAILKAVCASHTEDELKNFDPSTIRKVIDMVEEYCMEWVNSNPEIKGLHVEKIQDNVERALIKLGYADTAKEYIIYRQKRIDIRNSKDSISECISDLLSTDAVDNDTKRENGNIDGDSAMGTMLQIGSNVSKSYYLNNDISPDISKSHIEGYIHIHDLDFYKLTVTCCQIDCLKLFKGGFSTGHGFLREPNSINTYAMLAAIAIQSDQNDCHGGQSIPNFDYSMAPGIYKSFRKTIKNYVTRVGNLSKFFNMTDDEKLDIISKLQESSKMNDKEIEELLNRIYYGTNASDLLNTIYSMCIDEVDKQTYQAMEGFVHNLNTLHSRAGGQVPFSSINLGTDTSVAGRIVTKNLLLAMEAGLGHGETAIFPIVIFKVKSGVNYNPEDINYDLFKLACRVTSKRLFPNFSFLDSPHNYQYYKEGCPESEVTYMGCRTRVIGNVHDPSRETSHSRGNLSFTSINLPMIAIESCGDEDRFYRLLDKYLQLCKKQLLERLEIQSKRKVKNMPFLMGQGVWMDSEKLGPEDEVRDVLKHGTLSIGYIGLAEAMVALYGHHHGEGKEYYDKAYNIIKYMREYTDKVSDETKLNFSVLATPAEGLAGNALRKCRAKYGVIDGVTDKEYFTNSFHIPVSFPISAYEKIKLEAPFHELSNAGHITYIELDGDTSSNVSVIEKIVRCMHDAGIGYGAINHPVDRDPICGYTGVINDECPNCHRKEDGDVAFERIRRITGYLTGTLDRWNDAKKAEESDRVKHGNID